MAIVPSESKSSEIKSPSTKKKKSTRPIVILVVVVVVLIVAGFFITRLIGGGALSFTSKGDYQAVFLLNGQVYFGHVVKETKDLVVLRDIYYLRATAPLQQSETGEAGTTNELSLVKLGNELHGPKDEMRIVRNNVLFIEDLKPDSKVTVAIEDYIKEQQED